MLVVIATKEELKLVEKLGYEKNPILITGVGALNVMRALKDIPKDTHILNIGYCGSNKIKVGTECYIGKVQLHHENVEYAEPCYILGGDIPCYTSTDFVVKTKKESPCVFDMELAYICSMFNKVSAFKVVSDNLSVEDYEKNIK